MKQRNNELDVDFIGGQGSLTKAEEKAFSEFINAEKEKRALKKRRITKTKTIYGIQNSCK